MSYPARAEGLVNMVWFILLLIVIIRHRIGLHSRWDIEYADCAASWGVKLLKKKVDLGMIARLQFLRSGEYEVPLHCFITPRFNLGRVEYPFIAIIPMSNLTRRVPSMDKIDLFKNYLYSIETCAKKSLEPTKQKMQIWTYNEPYHQGIK